MESKNEETFGGGLLRYLRGELRELPRWLVTAVLASVALALFFLAVVVVWSVIVVLVRGR